MSSYPNSVFEPRVVENKPPEFYLPEKTTRLFAEDINDPNGEIVAVEEELGLLPKGAAASVRARLDLADEAAQVFAKSQVIAVLRSLVSDVSDVKGLWFFDKVGSETALSDRSGAGHNLDLSGQAQTLSPGVVGLAKYLTLAGPSSFYDTADHADFSVVGPLPFTIVWAGVLVDATGSSFLCKVDQTSGAGKYEWGFRSSTGDKLVGVVYQDGVNYIARIFNTAISGDQGEFHVYVMSYSGGLTNAAIKLYRDGDRVDNGNLGMGDFSNTNDTEALPASYCLNSSSQKVEAMKGKVAFLSFIKNVELSAAGIMSLSLVLQGLGNALAA